MFARQAFPHRDSPEGAIEHAGDNRTGEDEGDDEVINVDLATTPATIESIVFPVSIYDAASRSQSFGQVRNAYIRVVDRANGTELARYDLSEDASTETAMAFGELYRNGAEWKLRAIGQGYPRAGVDAPTPSSGGASTSTVAQVIWRFSCRIDTDSGVDERLHVTIGSEDHTVERDSLKRATRPIRYRNEPMRRAKRKYRIPNLPRAEHSPAFAKEVESCSLR